MVELPLKPKIDAEELEILDGFESGTLTPLADARAMMKQHSAAEGD